MVQDRRRHFLTLLAVLATVLVGYLVASFAGAFFTAAVMASALYPWQKRLTVRLRGKPYLAASALTIGVVVSVLLPLAMFGGYLVDEGNQALQWLNRTVEERGFEGVVEPLPKMLHAPALRLLESLPASVFGPEHEREAAARRAANPDPKVAPPAAKPATQTPGAEPPDPAAAPEETLGPAAASVSKAASFAFAGLARVGSLFAHVGMFVFALFFLLAEGGKLVDYLVRIAPLERARSRALLASFLEVSNGVLISALVTAASQTLVALIGFLIAGVQALPLLLFAVFICSFIPAVGGAVVTVVAGALVWMSGRVGMGIFLVVWGIALVGTVDNVVKPWVTAKRVQMPGSVVFFAMICGVAAFGPLGLVAGPILVAFFQAVMQMLREDDRDDAAAVPGPRAEP